MDPRDAAGGEAVPPVLGAGVNAFVPTPPWLVDELRRFVEKAPRRIRPYYDFVLTDNWRASAPMTCVPTEYRVGETVTVKPPKRYVRVGG